ncbi:hypothetical protein [Bradyrhizobium sp. LTSP857]|uniref:hypothetical protein n=1 Tax=Bradyrhizobium sp. LTSP857 TaxID=1619231 RepID=UPI0005D14718|nr:hypothetical protein [Bradyrhizobium sp. LTSP857]KJC38828.1 hypothetical protein UP06_28825 [Bradyrhizobium sp. LTSP857]
MAGRTISEKILARKSGSTTACCLSSANRGIRDGDILISDGLGANRNERTGETPRPEPLPPIMLAILDAGGLVPYMRQNGDFKL